MTEAPAQLDPGYSRALQVCLALNLAMVLVEGCAGAIIGSAALLADAIDFVEETAVFALALAAVGWSRRDRGTAGLIQAIAMGLVGLAAVGQIIDRLVNGGAPAPRPLALVALLALAVNFYGASRLAPYRKGDASMRGVWLSMRNDATLNLLTLFAAALITVTHAGWPDIVAGVVIAAVNLWAARGVFVAAVAERRAA